MNFKKIDGKSRAGADGDVQLHAGRFPFLLAQWAITQVGLACIIKGVPLDFVGYAKTKS
jgi:hypothetical protein